MFKLFFVEFGPGVLLCEKSPPIFMKGSSPSLLLEYSKVAAVHRPSLDHQGLTPPDERENIKLFNFRKCMLTLFQLPHPRPH